MRVVIAGAGSVGRSIARELLHNGHQVLLIDKDANDAQAARVPAATWLLADACEISSLHEANLEDCDVVVAATGDDKANLVLSLLAKTEFGVPRTVARVNNPKNEWLFDEAWGVDVAVSTPRPMAAPAWSGSPCRRTVRSPVSGSGTSPGPTTPSWWASSGKTTRLRRPAMTRLRPMTSCCSLPHQRSRTPSKPCSAPASGY